MDFHNDKLIELCRKNQLSYSDRSCPNTHNHREDFLKCNKKRSIMNKLDFERL